MELGYFTMPLHPPDTDIAQTLQDDLEQLVVLDELGYSEAWIGEHFTSVWRIFPRLTCSLRTRSVRRRTFGWAPA